jgi:hypothetical protein
MNMNRDIQKHNGFDLLRINLIKKLVLLAGFPYIFQILTLLVFLALAVIGWGLFPPNGVDDKLFAKTNLTNLTIWGLWWPLMIWGAVLFGRVWCSICPMEFISNFSERLGRVIGIRQKPVKKWLRSGFLIVAFYALIQLLVAGVHLHRIPAYTSIFLFTLLTIALFTGLFLKDRAFCRGFCPVGMLLNAYGRGSMLAVRHASDQTCASCTSRDCVLPSNRKKLVGRSCPSLLNPAKLNSTSDCLVCGQCIKSCAPFNMTLLLRRPFHPADYREPLASWPLTIFIMLVSGFVTYELCTEWDQAEHVFLWIPQQLSLFIDLNTNNGWAKGFWTLFIFPFLLWSLFGAIVKIFEFNTNLTTIWKRLALPLVIVISAGHMVKSIAKFVSWVGFLPYAIHDPSGFKTAHQFTSGMLQIPAPLIDKFVVSMIGIVIMLIGIYYAIREFRLTYNESHVYWLIPKFILGIMFLFIVFGKELSFS